MKAKLSKIKFELSLNPRIRSIVDHKNYIPPSYKAVLLLQADLELAWAWRFSKSLINPLINSEEKGLQERRNVPIILNLCEEYSIPITWATVGHIFMESCSPSSIGLPHPEIERLSNFENKFWKYDGKDWFDSDPCSDFRKSPAWYGPDIIDNIIDSSINHEIGCHTFSHIDCRDDVCSPEVFDSEIIACKKLANDKGIELKSFVHPAHTIGNIDRLTMHGLTSFRTDYENVLAYPMQHPSGIWEIKNTAALYYRKGWGVDYHIYRYKKIIDRAIKSNTVCCLWFHPSLEPKFLKTILTEIFVHINENQKDILISTTGDYIDWLNNLPVHNVDELV